MNINLSIDRLVLDNVSLASNERLSMQASIEAELTRLLTIGGVSNTLRSGGTVYNLKTAGIRLADDGSSVQLGEQIAGAVYQGFDQ